MWGCHVLQHDSRILGCWRLNDHGSHLYAAASSMLQWLSLLPFMVGTDRGFRRKLTLVWQPLRWLMA